MFSVWYLSTDMVVERVLGFLEIHDNDDSVLLLWACVAEGSEHSHGDCFRFAATGFTLD